MKTFTFGVIAGQAKFLTLDFNNPENRIGEFRVIKESDQSVVGGISVSAVARQSLSISLLSSVTAQENLPLDLIVQKRVLGGNWHSILRLNGIENTVETSTGDGLNPADDLIITGVWDFTSTAPYIGDYLDIISKELIEPYDPIPNSGIRYSVEEAAHGDLFLLAHSLRDGDDAGSEVLTFDEVYYPGSGPNDLPTTTFFIVLPTLGGSGLIEDSIPITASEIVAAFNDSIAEGRVIATLIPGHDGTGSVISGNGPAPINGPGGSGSITPHIRFSNGIITSPITIHPVEQHETPLTLRPALGSVIGTAVLNIEPYDGGPSGPGGYGISHLDSDGGGAFASEAITFSQRGHLIVNIDDSVNTLFGVKDNGFNLLSVGGNQVAIGKTLSLWSTTDQSDDAITLYGYSPGNYDGYTFRVTPAGEVHADGGIVLKDRTTDTPYRLFVDNGTLGFEAV